MPEPPIPREPDGARVVHHDTTAVLSRAPARSEGDSNRDTLDDRVADPRAPIGPGSRVGRYVIVRWLGAGGMGAVYEARDPDLDRPVAIKRLHGEVDEHARLRMEREARALARLSHPNVVQIHEIGRADGHTFIAMELVRGQPLNEWHERRPGWRECVRVYVQAGRGLAAAHAEGLVHRDFKPSNCILGDDGRVRVLDFGLARLHEPASEASDGTPHGEHRHADGLTQTGTFMGTLAYVPLEQLSGKAADAASDQFSFCVSLYEIHPRGSQPRDTTRLLAETLGILRGCPLVRSGRESTWVDGSRHRSSKSLLDRTARDRGPAWRPSQRCGPLRVALSRGRESVQGPPCQRSTPRLDPGSTRSPRL